MRIDRALQHITVRLGMAEAPRVIDRDARELREYHQRLLVSLAELTALDLVGQVQVPERLARDQHGTPRKDSIGG